MSGAIVQKLAADTPAANPWGVRFLPYNLSLIVGWEKFLVAGEAHAMGFTFDSAEDARQFFRACLEQLDGGLAEAAAAWRLAEEERAARAIGQRILELTRGGQRKSSMCALWWLSSGAGCRASVDGVTVYQTQHTPACGATPPEADVPPSQEGNQNQKPETKLERER